MGERRTGIDRYALRLVQAKARELIGKYGFTRDDVHDIEQDLLADLLRRLPHFDGTKARMNTFTATVVNNQVASIIEARLREKRDHRAAALSLDEVLPTEEPEVDAALVESFDHDDYLRLTRGASRTSEESRDLSRDVEVVVQRLPQNLQKLCARLRIGDSASEVASELGIHRSTLYDRIRVIRAAFEEAGLDDYL